MRASLFPLRQSRSRAQRPPDEPRYGDKGLILTTIHLIGVLAQFLIVLTSCVILLALFVCLLPFERPRAAVWKAYLKMCDWVIYDPENPDK